MGDVDELGPRECCILPCLAPRSLLGPLSAAAQHGGVPGRELQQKREILLSLCRGGQGRPLSGVCPPQREEICSLRCGTGFLVCTPALSLASQDLASALLPSFPQRSSQLHA